MPLLGLLITVASLMVDMGSRHYDPLLKPYEVSADGKRSGTPDDMWAFTTRNPRLDLQASGVFFSAARVLRGYNEELADRAEKQAVRLRQEAEELLAKHQIGRASCRDRVYACV